MLGREINQMTLFEMSGFSPTSIAKHGKGINIKTEILFKIWTALNSDVGDFIEILPDEAKREKVSNNNVLFGRLQNED